MCVFIFKKTSSQFWQSYKHCKHFWIESIQKAWMWEMLEPRNQVPIEIKKIVLNTQNCYHQKIESAVIVLWSTLLIWLSFFSGYWITELCLQRDIGICQLWQLPYDVINLTDHLRSLFIVSKIFSNSKI